MSDVETALTASGEQLPTESATPEPATLQQRAADTRHGTRIKVSVHRLDGGLEGGESDARVLTSEGFPIFTPPDSDRARWIPARDIKYVVLGSVDDANLESDPGDKSAARKAILRFRDGEWIAAYMDPGQASDGVGLAIKIRLTESQRVIPALAASAALLEMQFVDAWTSSTDAAAPHRRRTDIMEAARRSATDRSTASSTTAPSARSWSTVRTRCSSSAGACSRRQTSASRTRTSCSRRSAAWWPPRAGTSTVSTPWWTHACPTGAASTRSSGRPPSTAPRSPSASSRMRCWGWRTSRGRAASARRWPNS